MKRRSADVWAATLLATRRAGFGVDKGNYIRGVTIVAAPVIGIEGWMTHALVTVGLSDQMRRPGPSEVGAGLRAAAARVSAQLGGFDGLTGAAVAPAGPNGNNERK